MEFNLDGYETVKQRKNKFKKDWKEGVIIVSLITPAELLSKEACFKASVWRDRQEYQKGLPPDSTGHAYENSGMQGASKTSWVENAEESAIGRALDNFGYHGGDKCSKEEIGKVNRADEGKTVKEKPNKDKDDDLATPPQKQYVADLLRPLYPLQSQQEKIIKSAIGKVKLIEELTFDEAHDLIVRLKKEKAKGKQPVYSEREEDKQIEDDGDRQPLIAEKKEDDPQIRAINALVKTKGIKPEQFREKLISTYKTERLEDLTFDQKADTIQDLNSGRFLK